MITITEALAEIPTIGKRIEKKREFILNFLFRQSAIRDPHEKDGGSAALIEQERQAIKDLNLRLIKIRAAIQKANAENTITIENTTWSIGDWLTWRREIAPGLRQFYNTLANNLDQMRKQAMQKGFGVSEKDTGSFSSDFVVNISEKDLAAVRDELENTLGVLDGQLSLKNATITIDL